MASLCSSLFDLTNSVAYIGAIVTAYLKSDQGLTVFNTDGSPILPMGSAQGTSTTDSAGIYTITGLTAATVYDLWVEPLDQDPFWITDRVPDITNTITPCILYGTLADPKETNIVWAFLEKSSVTTDGLYINQGVVFAETSRYGSFSLKLWPTTSLIAPRALYRVTVGKRVYRGSVPSQTSISLKDWIALSTTQALS